MLDLMIEIFFNLIMFLFIYLNSLGLVVVNKCQINSLCGNKFLIVRNYLPCSLAKCTVDLLANPLCSTDTSDRRCVRCPTCLTCVCVQH